MKTQWISWFGAVLILANASLADHQRRGLGFYRTAIRANEGADTEGQRGPPYNRLPLVSSSRNSNETLHMEACESLLYSSYSRMGAITRSEYTLNMLIALVQSKVYDVIYQHRYETFQEMRLAQGREVDERKCLEQLENMAARVRANANEGFRSSDSNIYHILDLWGREPTRHLKAHLFFEGAYEDCLEAELRLDLEGRSHAAMRYCVMKFKYSDWAPLDRHDIIGLSMGVCIPKSCGSSNFGNKFELLGDIAGRRLTAAERSQTRVSSLYCLPDEDSPLRSIWRSPKATITLACLCSWLALLLYATYKQSNGLRAGEPHSALFRALSIGSNFRSLFNTKSKKADEKSRGEKQGGSRPQLDLGCIDGIKVIAMCYTIMGHVLMCITTMMRNGRDLADRGVFSVAFLVANLLPAFSVNAFFAVTGLLTSYLVFKQDERRRMITSPSKWLAFVLLRYLRIMPMYALAVLYCKHLARFTGSGPLWDYGTSALSQRRTCEHEHWAWTLTFSSNFLSPFEHCIPGGWYLANDFQFALVTPLYMAALHWRPRLGQWLLYASLAASYIWGYVSLYNSELEDFRPIANFSPSGFKTYVSHLGFNYTQPHFRIPAYLIGLLAGYKLFRLERQRAAFERLPPGERQHLLEPGWSGGFRKYGAYMVSYIVLNIALAPFFGQLLPFGRQISRVIASWANPALHLHFAAGVAHFIMLAATGDANKRLVRLLAAAPWRPLARMSLSCLLFNVEIINFVVQRQTQQVDISNGTLMLLNLICIAASYAAATILSCLFEAPISQALKVLIARSTTERVPAKGASGTHQDRVVSNRAKSAC